MTGRVSFQYTLQYPWQIEELLTNHRQRKYRTGFRGKGAYDQWQCAYKDTDGTQCPVMIDNVDTKSKKRMYCEPHRRLVILLDTRERVRRFNERKKQVIVLP